MFDKNIIQWDIESQRKLKQDKQIRQKKVDKNEVGKTK